MEQPEVVSPTNSKDDNSSTAEPTKEEGGNASEHVMILFGGTRDEACYALLDGVFEEPETGQKDRVTVPITKLPAILGRTHETKDAHFFGLGPKKAISRNHFKIYYRDQQGCCVEWDAKTNKLQYNEKKKCQSSLIEEGDLPERGFFVIECLGKNRIFVDKERLEQGQAKILKSGSAIRVSSYMLYFMLPDDAKSSEHVVVMKKSAKKKRSVPKSSGPSAKKAKTASASGGPHSELDHLSTETLLDMMHKAFESGIWERKDQIIGTKIALRAVVSAAEDPEIQKVAVENPGVSRNEIMDWIEKSDKYSTWVKQMLSKMEHRSYVASITKSLIGAGWTRTGGSGRNVKWELPKNTKITAKIDARKGEKAEENVNDKGDGKSVDEKKVKAEEKEEEKGGESESDHEKEASSAGMAAAAEDAEGTPEQGDEQVDANDNDATVA